MTSTRRALCCASLWVALFTFAGCGSKSALTIDPVPDSGTAEPEGPPEICNGLDDDDDGRVDETLPVITCGRGACAETACEAMCVPSAPSPEMCGGGDEDCDGFVDEGLAIGPTEIIDVREGAGGYDRCSTCRWASNTQIVRREGGGAFVFWTHSIYGGSEIANVWGRELDAAMRPIGEPRLLSDTLVLLFITRVPGLYEAHGLHYGVQRIGSEDRPVFVRATPDGVAVEAFPDTPSHCSSSRQVAFVGGRVIAGCLSRDDARLWTFPVGGEVTRLDLDVEGRDFSGGTLHVRGDAVYLHGYHVIPSEEFWTSFTRFTPDLDVVLPMTRSEASYARVPVLFPTSEGFVYWNTDAREATTYELLDEDGAVVQEAREMPFRIGIDPARSASWSSSNPARRFLTVLDDSRDDRSELEFMIVNADGTLTHELAIPLPADPDFASDFGIERIGSMWWTTWIAGRRADLANPVHVMGLSCIDE